uniref:Uncharacterized protein n=1 Tax=Siphoviridae sp. ctxdc10 TaxID=2825740 RepID=A0A8S5TSI6_9CAUD|nr:MAG TPA: hypothetical protein [Siphoviridae sp. ctxdc10]
MVDDTKRWADSGRAMQVAEDAPRKAAVQVRILPTPQR